MVIYDKVYSRYEYSLFINISASARLINMVLVSKYICYCIISLIVIIFIWHKCISIVDYQYTSTDMALNIRQYMYFHYCNY